MKFFLSAFLSVFLLYSHAWAKPLPPEVLDANKAFNQSYAEQDCKTALKHGKIAWQEAEKLLGDNKTTGDLAYNYGLLAMQLGKYDEAIKPLTRSADLAALAGEIGPLLRLEREVELASVLIATNKRTKAWKRLDKAREFAGENSVDDSVFAGELRVHQARISSDNANRATKYSYNSLGTRINRGSQAASIQSKSAQFSNDALEIFDKNPDTTRPTYRAVAYKLIGFSHERNKEWKQALLAYQEAMEIQKTYSTIEDRDYITTIGRWINVRTHFTHDIDMEEAKKQGLCKCWPYDNEGAIAAKPIKRVPPVMPRKASTSGFSIVRFDLDDNGNVTNPEILQSWPVKMYDSSSLNSLKKWKYETKADGEEGAQRTGIVTTIKYILTDYYGSDPI